MRALSKADCGRTDRFSRDLLLFSRLAALEDCLFRQGTRRHGASRHRRRTGLRIAFAVLLGVSDHRVRSRVFLVPESVDAARPTGVWGENIRAPPVPALGQMSEMPIFHPIDMIAYRLAARITPCLPTTHPLCETRSREAPRPARSAGS